MHLEEQHNKDNYQTEESKYNEEVTNKFDVGITFDISTKKG